MQFPDIYFDPVWGNLYAVKENGIHQTFLLNSEYGQVYYSFVIRPIEIKIDDINYFDIVTPYGFSGPIVIQEHAGKKEALLKEFKESFDDYCNENRIITDSCRFSPWLKNYSDFDHMYELVPNFTTIGIDLCVENIFLSELSSKKRNMIRKASKLGVSVHLDFEGSFIDKFLSIYDKTILKNGISDYYRFSKEFLIENFKELKGRILIGYSECKGNIISIAIFLLSDYYIHYHLAANDPDYNSIPGNDALIYEVAQYGKDHGFKYLMLGGAGNNGALHRHKMGFTKSTVFSFYKGRRICNQVIYENLLENCTKVDKSFFPSYR